MTKVLHLVTGPSGAGKTSFCRAQEDWSHHRHNVDEWAKILRGAGVIEHTQDVWPFLVRSLRRQLGAGASPVCLDHVLDRNTFAPIASTARRHGYHLCLWVVSPSSPETCVTRVRKRRAEGGHGLNDATVRSLYGWALVAAAQLSRHCEDTYLVDADGTFDVLAHIRGPRAAVRSRQDFPAWMQDRFVSACTHVDVRDDSAGFETPRP